MARYVLSHRRAGLFKESQKAQAHEAAAAAFTARFEKAATVLGRSGDQQPLARLITVFEADPAEVAAQMAALPEGVLLEAERPRQIMRALPFGLDGALGAGDDLNYPGSGAHFSASLAGPAGGVASAECRLYLRTPDGRVVFAAGRSGADGAVTIEYGPALTPLALIILPLDHWSKVVYAPQSGQTHALQALPAGPGWWHNPLGEGGGLHAGGQGIRVGVADTGCGPHPALAHASLDGACLNGAFLPGPFSDDEGHGTHVCGIIAGSLQGVAYAGFAPASQLHAVRVFPKGQGANQGDVANAIEILSSASRCDLVNLSLGSRIGSQIEHDAILDAYERGTLCLCAAANDGGPVNFPAAYPEAAAVSAIGLLGWGPADSAAAGARPQAADCYGAGGLYLADFSSRGKELASCAPGVGIVSCAPQRSGYPQPYCDMNGTSMASPAACGALASRLSADPHYNSLPRDKYRAQYARQALQQACRDIGLKQVYQGDGLATY